MSRSTTAVMGHFICGDFSEIRTTYLFLAAWIIGIQSHRTVPLFSRPVKRSPVPPMPQLSCGGERLTVRVTAPTTFNVPDKTGRVSAMQEASATRLTSTYFGGNSTALGAVGGRGKSCTPRSGNCRQASHRRTPRRAISVTSTPSNVVTGSLTIWSNGNGRRSLPRLITPAITRGPIISTGNNSISVTSSNTSGNPHRTVQPTIVCNYIIRII